MMHGQKNIKLGNLFVLFVHLNYLIPQSTVATSCRCESRREIN